MITNALRQPYEWDKLHPFQRRSFRRFPSSTEFIGEIESFGKLASLDNGILGGQIHLKNGTSLEGVDEIILATGYKRSSSFLHHVFNRQVNHLI